MNFSDYYVGLNTSHVYYPFVFLCVLASVLSLFFCRHIFMYSGISGASLVVHWLRIRLPVQGTWVRALVWEDPTCRGTAKPVRRSSRACKPQLLKPVL